MLPFYLPQCEPFYKISVLTLQLQIGIKCNLVETKSFGLSAIKTIIKDTFSLPESLVELLSPSCEPDSATEHCIWQGSTEDTEVVDLSTSSNISNRAVTMVESIMAFPPSSPQGYILWQRQALVAQEDDATMPEIIKIDGWEFVRTTKIVDNRKPSPSSSNFKSSHRLGLSEDVVELIERAWIEEYMYTGDSYEDLRALLGHVKACSLAIIALDPDLGERRTLNKLRLRLEMRVLMESLKREVKVLTDETDSCWFYGFDNGLDASAHIPRQTFRPKGFRWARPGWM